MFYEFYIYLDKFLTHDISYIFRIIIMLHQTYHICTSS